jgi:hypothetical protein
MSWVTNGTTLKLGHMIITMEVRAQGVNTQILNLEQLNKKQSYFIIEIEQYLHNPGGHRPPSLI